MDYRDHNCHLKHKKFEASDDADYKYKADAWLKIRREIKLKHIDVLESYNQDGRLVLYRVF
jgi:hypothetical protein